MENQDEGQIQSSTQMWGKDGTKAMGNQEELFGRKGGGNQNNQKGRNLFPIHNVKGG